MTPLDGLTSSSSNWIFNQKPANPTQKMRNHQRSFGDLDKKTMAEDYLMMSVF
jgi:hypothetical protein